jgi:hypothetical protein
MMFKYSYCQYDSFFFFCGLSVLFMLHMPHFIPGLATESSSTQQCYMGICLPRELAYLYPREEPTTKPTEQKDRSCQRGDSERRRSTSVGEMEGLQEAGLCFSLCLYWCWSATEWLQYFETVSRSLYLFI